MFFQCQRCRKLIAIDHQSILVAYEGQSHCLMCRKSMGSYCATPEEQRALHFEEALANGEVRSVALSITCPLCPDVNQGTSLSVEHLRQMLESGEDITVTGIECGHTWKLTDAQVDNLRSFAGTIQ